MLLLHGDGFGNVAGLVYGAAAGDGDVVGEELEGMTSRMGSRISGGRGGGWYARPGGDLAVALDGEGEDAGGADGLRDEVGRSTLLLRTELAFRTSNQTFRPCFLMADYPPYCPSLMHCQYPRLVFRGKAVCMTLLTCENCKVSSGGETPYLS
jgi:hypothetical protein